jgi:type IV secretory pathway VirB6-like protein
MTNPTLSRNNPIYWHGLGAALLMLMVMLLPEISWAQHCSSNRDLIQNGASESGVVTAVIRHIQQLLQSIGSNLFDALVGSPEYSAAVSAALMLAIVFYGVLIVFDMADFTPGDLLMRMLKIAAVAWVALPGGGGWEFFSGTIGNFLWGTMTEMINLFTCTATTQSGNCLGSTGGGGNTLLSASNMEEPLKIFNSSVGGMFSQHFLITLYGTLTLSSYGFVIAIFILWGAATFIFALLGAIYTYVKTMVGLWFIFSMMPIFFICLLFQRTSRLFDGAINLMVGMALEVVLLFAFLSFFVVVVTASLENLLLIEWCRFPIPMIGGIEVPLYRPVSYDNGLWKISDVGRWPLAGVPATNTQTGQTVNLLFPMRMIDVLFFLLASYITWQYSSFVGQLAGELTSSGMRMGGAGEAMRQFFRDRGLTARALGSRGLRRLLQGGR